MSSRGKRRRSKRPRTRGGKKKQPLTEAEKEQQRINNAMECGRLAEKAAESARETRNEPPW